MSYMLSRPFCGAGVRMLLFLKVIFMVATVTFCVKVKNQGSVKTTVRQREQFDPSGDYMARYKKTQIVGNTSSISDTHPVIVAVLERWKTGSKPGMRSSGDNQKIALSIEGGGMRGCVSAGATAAINFLGLNDAIDVVYGSSAGSMVAAYFISRQYSGVQIYHGMIRLL
jgi:hypothetical protein